jgi:hypothetical protein
MPPNENADSNKDAQAVHQATHQTSGPENDKQEVAIIAITRSPENELLEPVADAATEPAGKHRRKRIRIGEALRQQGIDEHSVAEGYADVMDKLKGKPEDDKADRLLVDVLKQCSKLLDQENGPTKPQSDATAVPVVVLHNMLRPQRGPGPSGDKSGSKS